MDTLTGISELISIPDVKRLTVRSIVFSASGDKVAISGYMTIGEVNYFPGVIIVDSRTMTLLHRFSNSAAVAAFLSDGQSLLMDGPGVCRFDGTQVWTARRFFGRSALSPDEQTCYVMEGGTLRAYRMADGTELWTSFPGFSAGFGGIANMAVSQDGSFAYVYGFGEYASENGIARVPLRKDAKATSIWKEAVHAVSIGTNQKLVWNFNEDARISNLEDNSEPPLVLTSKDFAPLENAIEAEGSRQLRVEGEIEWLMYRGAFGESRIAWFEEDLRDGRFITVDGHSVRRGLAYSLRDGRTTFGPASHQIGGVWRSGFGVWVDNSFRSFRGESALAGTSPVPSGSRNGRYAATRWKNGLSVLESRPNTLSMAEILHIPNVLTYKSYPHVHMSATIRINDSGTHVLFLSGIANLGSSYQIEEVEVATGARRVLFGNSETLPMEKIGYLPDGRVFVHSRTNGEFRISIYRVNTPAPTLEHSVAMGRGFRGIHSDDASTFALSNGRVIRVVDAHGDLIHEIGTIALPVMLSSRGQLLVASSSSTTTGYAIRGGVEELRLDRDTLISGESTTARFRLHEPAPAGGARISISQEPGLLTPRFVDIPEGASEGTFTVTAEPVNISFQTSVQATWQLVGPRKTVNVLDATSMTMRLSRSEIPSGETATGTIEFDTVSGPGGREVSLTVSRPGIVTVQPATVVVPAGERSGTFTVRASSQVTSGTVAITAHGSGLSDTKNVTVVRPAVQLRLEPGEVKGGVATLLRIVLGTLAPANGTIVNLTSSSPSARVTSTTTIAEGTRARVVGVRTSPVSTTQTVTLTGTLADGRRGSAALTLLPPELREVLVTPLTVGGGEDIAIFVKLDGNAPVGGMSFDMTSQNPAVLPVPSRITVPGGAFFQVISVRAREVQSTTRVRITVGFWEFQVTVVP
jgi:hypothetical protein